MKKIALLVCNIGLLANLPIAAMSKQQTKTTSVSDQLTPEQWDKELFTALTSEEKKEVIGILQSVQKCFLDASEAVDKGVDAFMEAYGQTMQFYSKIVTAITPRVDMYKSKMGIIRALEIVPSIDNAWDIVMSQLSVNPQMTEQDFKRGLNKVFRNKETKTKIKTILKKQHAEISEYIVYLNKFYTQEVSELAEQMKQIKELIQQLQDQQG